MSLKRLTAAQLMTEAPIMIEPSRDLAQRRQVDDREAFALLAGAGGAGRVVAVITSKDIIQVLCEGEPEMLDQLLVKDVMTAPALCVQEELLIHDCLRLMRMSGVRSVPVVRGLTPVGILSFTDVCAPFRAKARRPPKQCHIGAEARLLAGKRCPKSRSLASRLADRRHRQPL